MADKIQKALAKLNPKERMVVDVVISKILVGELKDLDVKQLVGQKDTFRVRKGAIRIIFSRGESGKIILVDISRRSEKTYREF